MAKNNQEIVEDLFKDLDIESSKPEVPDNDDNIEFQDALGPTVEDCPNEHEVHENDQISESDYEDEVNSEDEVQLSEEEIEVILFDR